MDGRLTLKVPNSMNGSKSTADGTATEQDTPPSCCADAVYSVCCCPAGGAVICVCCLGAFVSTVLDTCCGFNDIKAYPLGVMERTFDAMMDAPCLKCCGKNGKK